MAFIELKDIGKIYVSEGSIGVGIRGVNLSFERHEFVAVTGQSGSGKSTLLNVISGMDSYEEGEMYVEGEPTSHYIQQDWEEYRKKYISFIFQDYNIIESMTVLQNVELSLMHIEDVRERRQKAIELLTRVGLEKHLHHKGSQLSGGQKQRTVIARALSKDSPIILADEPTGNLDSQSSKEIIELLREVSQDKLVIIVTHSFDEVEEYATRHIRIFDGAIEADEYLTPKSETTVESAREADRVSTTETLEKAGFFANLKNGLTLGRIRFLAKPKLSIFICFLLIIATLAVTLISSMFGDIPEIVKKDHMFTYQKGRVVLSRSDGQVITDSELEELVSELGAKSYMHYDYLLDYTGVSNLTNYEYYSGALAGISNSTYVRYSYDTNIKPDVGRLPEKDRELFLCLPLDQQKIYGKNELKYTKYELGSVIYDIVGIKYYQDNNLIPTAVFTESGYKLATAIALYSRSMDNFTAEITVKDDFDYEQSYNLGGSRYGGSEIQLSFDIGEREFAITDGNYSMIINEFNRNAKQMEALGIQYSFGTECVISGMIEPAVSNSDSLFGVDYYGYYYDGYPAGSGNTGANVSMSLEKYTQVTDSSAVSELTRALDGQSGLVLSPYIIYDLVENEYYPSAYTQASIFFKNDGAAHKSIKTLEDKGYVAVSSDTTVKSQSLERIIRVFLLAFQLVIWVLSIVFIAMLLGFVTTKAMAASANEIGIMRSMGISVKVIKISIYVQTMIALIPSYIGMLLFALLIFRFPETNAMFVYMYWWQYLIIALGILIIDVRLSRKYVKRIFNTSVKNTLRGGAAQ